MTGLDIAQVRPVIESEIERLIALLDLLEPDPDFEDGADLEADTSDFEPLLGAPERQPGSWGGIESNFSDDEPWLGASEPVYNGSYSRNSIKDMINRHMRPDLYAGTPSVTTGETSQLGWSFHKVSDDRELVDEREPFGEGSSCYAGPCSPISTMVGQPL